MAESEIYSNEIACDLERKKCFTVECVYFLTLYIHIVHVFQMPEMISCDEKETLRCVNIDASMRQKEK